MQCDNTNFVENSKLWALEPAVTPVPGKWAFAFGLLVAIVLVSLSWGISPAADVQEWHGNVAASEKGQPYRLGR